MPRNRNFEFYIDAIKFIFSDKKKIKDLYKSQKAYLEK